MSREGNYPEQGWDTGFDLISGIPTKVVRGSFFRGAFFGVFFIWSNFTGVNREILTFGGGVSTTHFSFLAA